MTKTWEMDLFGFGIGISIPNGNRSFIEFKPAYTMSHADSIESAIRNIMYKGVFENLLIKEYGESYRDSIQR